MQRQTVVNSSSFLKYSWAHVAIFYTAAWRFLMQCHLRGQTSSKFNWGFLPCPTCALNLFTILCMVLGERPKFFAILHCEMWFLICLTLLLWNLAQSDEPWSSFVCKDWDAPFIPKHGILAYCMTNSPAYCELFQNSLTWIFYNLFTFILPLSQLFWNVLQPSKTTFVHTYKIHLRWSVKTFLCTFVN